MRRSTVGHSILAAVMAFWLSPPALAEEDFTLADVWSDTTHYFTSPIHWDGTAWALFGGTVAAVAAAHQFDGRVRDHFAGKSPVLDGKDKNSTRDALPAAALVAGTLFAGVALDEKPGRIEAYRMLEAATLGGITTEAFKFAAGRERPDETLQVNAWRKGGNSFPSLHATAAFAIGTVLAESGSDDYRWIRRVLGYGVASYTAYARLHANAHWLSDVVAGSAVGIYAGAYTVDRRYASRNVTFNVVPTPSGGVEFKVSYAFGE